MNKRILSALLALCLTCSMAGTALAAGGQATPETARAAAAAAPAQPAAAAPQPEEEPSADATSQPEEDTAAAQPAAATAETAAPATPETAALPARTIEVTDAASGITVTVDVPEGALPADAELQVTLLGGDAATPETAQTPDDVAGELDGAGIEYDDFVSLDLTFYDAAGQEVEPLKPVQVRFTMPAALLPDDVDPATLAVQHLAEDENGEVETVETLADAADTADGTVTLDGDVTAAFETDGFSVYALTFSAKATPRADGDGSTFTFRWNREWGLLYENTHDVVFHIVDTEGNPIAIDANGNANKHNFDLTWKDTNPTYVAGSHVDWDGSIRGLLGEEIYQEIEEEGEKPAFIFEDPNDSNYQYEYVTAMHIDDRTGRRPLSGFDLGQINARPHIWIHETVYGEYNSGNTALLTEEMDYDDKTTLNIYETSYLPGDHDETLYLVYRRVENPTPDIPMLSPTVGKKAVLDEADGTYDLSLSVSNELAKTNPEQKIDVLFLIDGSTSMKDPLSEQDSSITRLAAMNQAIDSVVDQLEAKDKLDIRYSAVQFGVRSGDVDLGWYFADARQLIGASGAEGEKYKASPWTENPADLKTAVETYSTEGELMPGTNVQAGLMLAQAALTEARPDARQFVILISDGKPSNYYDSTGLSYGTSAAGSAPYAPPHTYYALEKLRKRQPVGNPSMEPDDLPLDGLYYVYIGDEALDYEVGEGEDKVTLNFQDEFLKNVFNTGSKTTPTTFYIVQNSNQMEDVFSQLTGTLSGADFTNIRAEDPLSQYVDAVSDEEKPEVVITRTVQKVDEETGQKVVDENGKPVMIEVEVPKDQGAYDKIPADNPYKHLLNPYVRDIDYNTGNEKDTTHNIYDEVTATYDHDTKVLRLSTNPLPGTSPDDGEEYYLRSGYTYSAVLDIKTNAAASHYMATNGVYPNTADADTGTHAGELGFFSNKNEKDNKAKLGYAVRYDSNTTYTRSVDFPKPVVRVNNVQLTVTKTVKGAMGAYDDDFNFTLVLSKEVIPEEPEEPENPGEPEEPAQPITVYWTEPLKIVNPDPTAGITGTTAENFEGWDLLGVSGVQMAPTEPEPGEEPGEGTDPDTGGDVAGEAGGGTTPGEAGGDTDPGTSGESGGGTDPDPEKDRTYEFILSHGEQIVLEVPSGYTATIVEVDAENRGYKTESRSYATPNMTAQEPDEDGNTPSMPQIPIFVQLREQKPELNGDMTADFLNTREAVAPTGLEGDHTAPYVLMVSASALAGMALLAGMAARRARRRREW